LPGGEFGVARFPLRFVLAAGAALGPLPFGLAYDLLGGYDPAIAALLALPIAATAAVLLAKPPAPARPTVATAERRG
jgi:cyanate permease